MSNLLAAYEEMQKQAEQEKVAQERFAVIEKYAEVAENILKEASPNDYTAEEVALLADRMIEHDLAVEEQQEKIAELDEAGRIMARAFFEESQQLNQPQQ